MGVVAVGQNLLKCTMGVAPVPITIVGTITGMNLPLANIKDSTPFVNILPFGMCMNPLNPAVAAIIASSLGTVQVGPCVPLPTPWTPIAPTIQINNLPILTNTATKLCYPGGIITIAVITTPTIIAS